MESSEAINDFFRIFYPGYLNHIFEVESNNRRFAYYTSADTAKMIIENEEVWLRNATVMNDFSEISYGLNLTMGALSGPVGENFGNAVNAVFPDVMDKVKTGLNQWVKNWRLETYLSCLSLHESSEDRNGRLSMWRAYGDIALIIKNNPLTSITDRLGVYSIPVNYLAENDCKRRLGTITKAISDNTRLIRGTGVDTFVNNIIFMVFLSAIGTKHPGFSEEKEWRIYFRPAEQPKTILTKKVVVINSVPQEVGVLPLKHDPDNGLHHADIPSLLDSIIIGPTAYPYVSARAFVALLEKAGVHNASRKVVVSDIPLRTHR